MLEAGPTMFTRRSLLGLLAGLYLAGVINSEQARIIATFLCISWLEVLEQAQRLAEATGG